jgi:hypothetical protein
MRSVSTYFDNVSENKKVHIIGYPFAGGQGPELSQEWLYR